MQNGQNKDWNSDVTQVFFDLGALGIFDWLTGKEMLVMTEDKFTDHLELVLESNNINLDKTFIKSYRDSGQVDNALGAIQIIKENMPDLKVVIHRDADCLVDYEQEKFLDRARKVGAFPLLTKNSDIESYFNNFEYVKSRVRDMGFDKGIISDENINEIIEDSYLIARDESLKKFKNHWDKLNISEVNGKYMSQREKYYEKIYDINYKKYAIGKKVHKNIIDKLMKYFASKGLEFRKEEFLQASEYLKIDGLEDFAC